MKTYKQRLPEVDKAIFGLGGDWPDKRRHLCVISTDNKGNYFATRKKYGDCDHISFVCTRPEFESRLADWRRLYEWGMVEIKPDKRPTLVEFIGDQIASGEYQHLADAEGFNWQKSLEEDMESALIRANKLQEKAAENQAKESNWYECGELPPVGEIVNYKTTFFTLDKLNSGACKILSYNRDRVWIEYEDAPNSTAVINTGVMEFRPLQSERDKLVDEAVKSCAGFDFIDSNNCGEHIKHFAEKIVDAGWRPTEKDDG